MALRRTCLTRAMSSALVLGAAIAGAPASAAPLDIPAASATPTSFIVKFKDAVHQQSLDKSLPTNVDLEVQRPMSFGADVVTAGRVLDDAEVSAVLKALDSDPNVEYVVPNAVLSGSAIPNDPRFPDQWHLHDTAAGIEMPEAWDLATGVGVTVAVIDSGRMDHPDLTPAYIGGYDFISTPPGPGIPNPSCDGDGRDADPTDACDYGHGLRTGGTIAATTDNDEGVAGVAFGARIVPVRVLSNNGASIADIVDGLNWATGGTVPGVPPNPNPASVVNLSLNAPLECLEPVQLALDAAVAAGAVVVVSAGNSGQDVSTEMPGNCTGDFLRVAASDRAGNLTSYSNYGPLVDITAPGGVPLVDITAPGGVPTPNPEDGILVPDVGSTYTYAGGTSYAAPQVAGVAALIKQVAPELTPIQVINIIKQTAKPLPGSCGGGCGAGLLDAHAAVQAARSTPGIPVFGSTGS